MKFFLTLLTAAAAVSLASGCQSPVNLGIALDNSGSLSSADFLQVKQFIESLIGTDFQAPSNLGLFAFYKLGSVVGTKYISFQNQRPRNPNATIDNIAQRGLTPRNTYDGIQQIVFDMVTAPAVAATGAKKLLVITDGVSADTTRTQNEANRARAAGWTVYALGIGGDVNDAELEAITGGNTSRVVKVVSASDLQNSVQQVGDTICDN